MARILLTGVYAHPEEYVLKEESGKTYMALRAGETFHIGKNTWHVEKAPRRGREGTILLCRLYGADGRIRQQHALPHKKKILWATTSGSARNGLWHYYHEPKDDVERICGSMGIPWDRREKVPYIDISEDIWDDGWKIGQAPGMAATDGKIQFGAEDDWTGFFMPSREYDGGIKRLAPDAGEDIVHIFNAAYCILFTLSKDRAFGRERLSVDEVLYTDDGISACARELKKLHDKYYRLPAEGSLAS